MRILAWAARFLVGFLVVIVLSDAASPQVGDTYRGGYFCGQGYTNLNIYIQSNTTASSWMVLFTFSVPTSPFCTGSYTASVAGSGSTLTMTGSSWISNPCSYGFLSTITLVIQGTNATPVWYTASIGGSCQQLLVGKSTLRKPCKGVKNGTTSLALLCSIETDTSTPTNAETISTSWTEAQSRHSASTSFALSSASPSRSCAFCSVTHSSSSSQSAVSESSVTSMSPSNSISTTFPTHSVQKSSSHSQSLASWPSSTASMSFQALRTTTKSHSRITQHSPSVSLKRSDSSTRSRQRSHEHSLTLIPASPNSISGSTTVHSSTPTMTTTGAEKKKRFHAAEVTHHHLSEHQDNSHETIEVFIPIMVPPQPITSVPDLQRISAVTASSVLFVGSVAGAGGSTAGSSRIGALSVAQCAIVDASNTADGIAGLFPFGYLVPGDCLLSSAHADDITAIIGNFIIVVVGLVFFFFVCGAVALQSKALSIVEATRLFTFPLCVMPLWYAAVPSTAAAASHLVASFDNRVEGCSKTVTVVAIVGILIPAVTISAVVFTLFYSNAHFTTSGALERLAMPFSSTDIRPTYFVRRIIRIVKWSLRVCVHWVENPVLLEATSIISEESAGVRVTNKGKDPKFLVTRHFNALLSEYSFIPYALLDLTNTVIVSLLSGAALAIGSTSWCIANNAVAFTLLFVQLVVCIAVRPYVAWFFFLHSCSIQCLVVASAACSL
ncbi:membrane-associated protein, putative, partial [Bodo saltans]